MKIHALRTKDAGFWFGNEVADVKPGESFCVSHSYSASPRDKEKEPCKRRFHQDDGSCSGGRLDLGDACVSTPT